VCINATRAGHLDCLKYGHENRSCSEIAVHEMEFKPYTPKSESKLLDCMRYAHQNCQLIIHAFTRELAYAGFIEAMKYAHGIGCEWGSGSQIVCENAAFGGKLECLKYAHESGCEWSAKTCTEAARQGHFECLKYAHQNGCEIDITVVLPQLKRLTEYFWKLAHLARCTIPQKLGDYNSVKLHCSINE
jgi:hypothetical protein